LPSFEVSLETPFSLDYTLESGQVFRWENRGEWWYGVVAGSVIKARQEGDVLDCVTGSELLSPSFVRNYFRLDEDLQSVLASIMKDDHVRQAVQKFYGTRLVRQDRWECLASFVLATTSNIPRIKQMVSAVCDRFGAPTEFEGIEYRSFPRPETLAESDLTNPRACGLGYRAPCRLEGTAKLHQEGIANRLDFAPRMLGKDSTKKSPMPLEEVK